MNNIAKNAQKMRIGLGVKHRIERFIATTLHFREKCYKTNVDRLKRTNVKCEYHFTTDICGLSHRNKFKMLAVSISSCEIHFLEKTQLNKSRHEVST